MDDDEGIRDVVRVFLSGLGYRVEVVADGETVIESYRNALEEGDPFRVVILDLTVHTGKGGIETLRELKSIDPGVKAVITTGFTDDPTFSGFRAQGFVAAIPKPFHIRQLDETLREILS
jgi:DNA-binding NtrC family response regulator